MTRADRHFFEIPIYRLTVDRHTKALTEAKRKALKPLESEKKTAPESYAKAERWFDEHYWYPWRYNEVIGWLRLYVLGTQIRGELWFIRAKRITQGTRKKIYLVGKAFEKSYRATQTNKEIERQVTTVLKQLAREPRMKARYLDLECFHVAAPHLNWRSLLDFPTNAA